MKIIKQESKDILSLEKMFGCELEVRERPDSLIHKFNLKKYYCFFKGLEVKDGPILKGGHGNGNTIDETIEDYAENISFKRVVFDAYKPTRREYTLPKIVYRGNK